MKASRDWNVGFSRREITPKESAWLAGFASRIRPSEKVGQPIYVKAMVIADEKTGPAVLVSADLLGFSSSVSETILHAVSRQLEIDKDRVLLTATHTHSAPVIDGVAPLIYNFDACQQAAVGDYTRFVIDSTVAAIKDAVADLRPSRIEYGQAFAGFGVNRRRVRPGCLHLPAAVDHDVPVLAIREKDGRLRGLVFGYACHATVLGGYEISGDYAGYAQTELEKNHPGCTALFVPGCGGDINALPRGSVECAARYGTLLATAVNDALGGAIIALEEDLVIRRTRAELAYASEPSLAQLEEELSRSGSTEKWLLHQTTLVPPKQRLPRDEALKVATLLAENERKMIRHQIEQRRGEQQLHSCSLALYSWCFGNQLTWLHIGGEPVVDYSLYLKERYGWGRTWVSGYCYDLTTYIPSLRVLTEGDYEGIDAVRPFGHPAPFDTSVERSVLESIESLIRGTPSWP